MRDVYAATVWYSCPAEAQDQCQTRGRMGPQLQVGELHWEHSTRQLWSSLSYEQAHVPHSRNISWVQDQLAHLAHIALREPMTSLSP